MDKNLDIDKAMKCFWMPGYKLKMDFWVKCAPKMRSTCDVFQNVFKLMTLQNHGSHCSWFNTDPKH